MDIIVPYSIRKKEFGGDGCLAQSLRSRICDKHPCWL